MDLLPHSRLQIETAKSPKAVYYLMKFNVSPKRPGLFGQGDPNKDFWGEVDPAGFRVVPYIGYRNSFIPQITGRILDTGPTVVEIRMTLLRGVRVLMSVMLSMLLLLLLLGCFLRIWVLIPPVLFFMNICYWMPALNFWIQVKNAKKRLIEIIA